MLSAVALVTAAHLPQRIFATCGCHLSAPWFASTTKLRHRCGAACRTAGKQKWLRKTFDRLIVPCVCQLCAGNGTISNGATRDADERAVAQKLPDGSSRRNLAKNRCTPWACPAPRYITSRHSCPAARNRTLGGLGAGCRTTRHTHQHQMPTTF